MDDLEPDNKNRDETKETLHEVASMTSGELRTLSCKLLGLAHLMQERTDRWLVPLNEAEGHYGIGLILEEIGESIMDIGRSLDDVCVQAAKAAHAPE